MSHFDDAWNALATDVYENAKAHGWYDQGPRNQAEVIALIHSELSEALEALRKHPDGPDHHLPDYLNVEVELADAVIRIMDFSAAHGYDVARAILAKHEYNKQRPYKHGGKRF